MNITLYEILGVEGSATQDQIKRAYKKKSKEHHPDKGGDAEKFKVLVAAYNILFDEEKRARYDGGESADAIQQTQATEDQKILSCVLDLFVRVVEGLNNVENVNLPDHLSKCFKSNVQQLQDAIDKETKKLQKFEVIIKRMKVKDGENYLARASENRMELIRKGINILEEQKRLHVGAQKFLEAYSYEFDPAVMTIPLKRTGGGGFFIFNETERP